MAEKIGPVIEGKLKELDLAGTPPVTPLIPVAAAMSAGAPVVGGGPLQSVSSGPSTLPQSIGAWLPPELDGLEQRFRDKGFEHVISMCGLTDADGECGRQSWRAGSGGGGVAVVDAGVEGKC